MKIILLNGPPRSGKDYAGRALRAKVVNSYIFKMARQLKERTHALYGLGEDGVCYPHDWYENVKDKPLEDFLGITPRGAYIAVSEMLMKPLHGEDIFGRWLCDDIATSGVDLALVTDAGFQLECETVIERFGADNVTLVRIHRDGCDFSSDSRSYIELDGVQCHDITNDGGPGFRTSLAELLLSSQV